MSITVVELIMRLGASVVLGSAIGYERELRERPAGLRTHFLVSLASATFMLVSSQFPFPQNYHVTVADGFLRADVGRIASNVVVGIGFLGGGAILHSGLRVEGLTTAASLWMVAAVGLASGAGLYVLAFATAVIALFAPGRFALHRGSASRACSTSGCASTRLASSCRGPSCRRPWHRSGPRSKMSTTHVTWPPTDRESTSTSDSRATMSRRRWSRSSRTFPAFSGFACAGRRGDGTLLHTAWLVRLEYDTPDP